MHTNLLLTQKSGNTTNDYDLIIVNIVTNCNKMSKIQRFMQANALTFAYNGGKININVMWYYQILSEVRTMGYTKISALSLTDLFVQQIENMILSGELAVGEQLPAARELSAKMGVSRPVISAGLVELEKLGFVEIVPRQGVYVGDYRRKGTVETLVAIMRYNGGAMRKNEVRSLLETRDSLESLCARLVIERAKDSELAALGPMLDAIRDAPDCDTAADAVFRFLHELAVLSGNVLLPLMYYSFRSAGVYLWSLYAKQNGIEKLYELKLDFYKALLNRDVDEAQSLTHRIMGAAIDNLSIYGS
jgi:DNA-binding FadR family transcriptional regulator